jgi:hypothetical protein
VSFLDLFRTRFRYERDEHSRYEERDALRAEFYRFRGLLKGAQESGAPLIVHVPALPAERTVLQRQLKNYLLFVQKEQADNQLFYRETEDPKYLNALAELSDLAEWLQHAIQYAGSQDPTNVKRDESRNVAVELPAFEGSCRVTFKENAAIAFLFALRPGNYTVTIEDDRRSDVHAVSFVTRRDDELYSLVFAEEQISPVERGSAIVSDGEREEVIPLD